MMRILKSSAKGKHKSSLNNFRANFTKQRRDDGGYFQISHSAKIPREPDANRMTRYTKQCILSVSLSSGV